MALNEAVQAIRRMVEQMRRFQSQGDATGEALLMQPLYGSGKPPMIASVLQPDR